MTKRGPLRGMKFGIEFSCHSMILNKFLDKELCREVSLISDYVEKEECICSWSLGKELYYCFLLLILKVLLLLCKYMIIFV